MKDETYLFHSDCRDKKNVARSARNKRTHNGKSGGVKFPSDYMTKKEVGLMTRKGNERLRKGRVRQEAVG